jgi:hypothetical protein
VPKHVTTGGKSWLAAQPRGLAYWEGLAKTINAEPPLERDRIMLAMLAPLGIEKGKPFNPDARQKGILIEAAQVGEIMARANGYAKRFEGSTVWPGKKWEYSLFLTATNQEKPNRTELDAPIAQFWSFTVYDNETRALIDTSSYPDRSSRDDIVKNPDGSVDLYFGPQAPQGKPASNWIKTTPNKGWFTYFRLYGPTEAYFDKSWVLPDIVPVTQ